MSACDDMLVTLIQGKDTKSDFDRRLEAISLLLRRSAEEVRKGDWNAAQQSLDAIMNHWLGIYTAHLTDPPAGFEEHPDWKGVITEISPGFKVLGEHMQDRALEPYHQQVLATHAQLMQLYLGRGPEAVAVTAAVLTEPVDRLLDTGPTAISRTNLSGVLDLARTRTESLIPRSSTPEAGALGRQIVDQIIEIVKTSPSRDEAALRAEITKLRGTMDLFRKTFPPPTPPAAGR